MIVTDLCQLQQQISLQIDHFWIIWNKYGLGLEPYTVFVTQIHHDPWFWGPPLGQNMP